MCYRQAKAEDLAALKTLWAQCFGDGEEEICAYFTAYGTQNTFLAVQKETVAAMVIYFQTELILQDGESVAAAYLYCFCTRPELRGQKIGSGLLAFAESRLKELGFACTMLVPGEKSLFDFYEKLGYRTAFTYSKTKYAAQSTQAIAAPVSANRYWQLRQMLLWENCVLNSEKDICFCQTLYHATLLEINANGSIGCAIAAQNGERLLVFDLLAQEEEQAAQAVMAYFGVKEAVVYSPGTQRHGMVKWLDEEKELTNAYLGLTFG